MRYVDKLDKKRMENTFHLTKQFYVYCIFSSSHHISQTYDFFQAHPKSLFILH